MISAWGGTDKGAVRRENQDACYVQVTEDRHTAVGVVCDGMGGARAGDVASRTAVEVFLQAMEGPDYREGRLSDGEILEKIAREANRRIFLRSETDQDCLGMGTTMVGLILREQSAVVVNVGDSRAYHVTADGIHQVTRDHSVVEDLVAQGDITPDEARHHPQKNLITRALGTGFTVKPDLFSLPLRTGELLLLCSDGLVNELTDGEIHSCLTADHSLEEIGSELIARTLEHGAKDNVTVVLFRQEPEEAEREEG